jgi:hypothetical protein
MVCRINLSMREAVNQRTEPSGVQTGPDPFELVMTVLASLQVAISVELRKMNFLKGLHTITTVP